MTDVPALAQELGLEPHPEGGWYRETWRSPVEVVLPDGRRRSSATLIWFLLPAGVASSWHRVASDEIWLAHTGSVRLELGDDGPRPMSVETVTVGTDHGTSTQALVPANTWQRTVPGPSDALVSCLVSPGFDFDDFELA
ncbi:MAG TPA: cupin domain-containing protein [Aeromicrobium sp.]|nr:cupin domain-containing protein [Aeromicrobium sp.]